MKKLLILIPPTVFAIVMVLHKESKKDRKTVSIGRGGVSRMPPTKLTTG